MHYGGRGFGLEADRPNEKSGGSQWAGGPIKGKRENSRKNGKKKKENKRRQRKDGNHSEYLHLLRAAQCELQKWAVQILGGPAALFIIHLTQTGPPKICVPLKILGYIN